jgi:hypothetical protein
MYGLGSHSLDPLLLKLSEHSVDRFKIDFDLIDCKIAGFLIMVAFTVWLRLLELFDDFFVCAVVFFALFAAMQQVHLEHLSHALLQSHDRRGKGTFVLPLLEVDAVEFVVRSILIGELLLLVGLPFLDIICIHL